MPSLLDEYGESHQNPANRMIHKFCVPAIMLSLLGLQVIPMLDLIHYSRGVLGWPHWLGVFVIAWIGQFIGHHKEGKKPSLFRDVFFLLIGPLWIVRPLVKN